LPQAPEILPPPTPGRPPPPPPPSGNPPIGLCPPNPPRGGAKTPFPPTPPIICGWAPRPSQSDQPNNFPPPSFFFPCRGPPSKIFRGFPVFFPPVSAPWAFFFAFGPPFPPPLPLKPSPFVPSENSPPGNMNVNQPRKFFVFSRMNREGGKRPPRGLTPPSQKNPPRPVPPRAPQFRPCKKNDALSPPPGKIPHLPRHAASNVWAFHTNPTKTKTPQNTPGISHPRDGNPTKLKYSPL